LKEATDSSEHFHHYGFRGRIFILMLAVGCVVAAGGLGN
jgi:hypothetical protein